MALNNLEHENIIGQAREYMEREPEPEVAELSEEEKQILAKHRAEQNKADREELARFQTENHNSKYEQIGQSVTNTQDGELTQDELNRIKALKDSIKIDDVMSVSNYGVGVQKQLGSFSEKLLENVSTKDTGEVGELLDEMLSDINTVDTQDFNKKQGFIKKIFKKASKKTSELLNKYQSVSTKIDSTSLKLTDIQLGLKDDINNLNQMGIQNIQYGKAVNLYIIAGEEKVRELKETELPKAKELAQDGDIQAQQNLQRMSQEINRLEKRIYDLQTSKAITLQSAPQIDVIRNNSLELMEKINTSINTVIPLWKNQITISLTLRNQANAQKANKAIREATDKLLLKNAEMLKQNSIDIARQAEEGIVSIETLEQTQQKLIETIEETMKIQKEGTVAREKARVRMQEMENELKVSLKRLADDAMDINKQSYAEKPKATPTASTTNDSSYLNL